MVIFTTDHIYLASTSKTPQGVSDPFQLTIMPVYRDYEIRLNLNELIEHRIPTCDLLHPDHCLSEAQVAQIAHDINMDLDLHPIYHQIDDHIMRYVKAAGIDNTEHWVEPRLEDL